MGVSIYRIVPGQEGAAYLGADLAQLDGLTDAELAEEISTRFDAAVERNVDPHADASYLRALVIQTGRDGFRAGRLQPMRIRAFAL